jgi:hypothetical protein
MSTVEQEQVASCELALPPSVQEALGELRACRPEEPVTLASTKRSDSAACCAREAWTSSHARDSRAPAETPLSYAKRERRFRDCTAASRRRRIIWSTPVDRVGREG